MQVLLKKIFKNGKGKNTKTRIMEAAAIAAYHRQTCVPVIDILLADDAPQFKKIVEELALCWIHRDVTTIVWIQSHPAMLRLSRNSRHDSGISTENF